MDGDKNELIRARAYEIWEREGRPADRESEHWRQAELELQEAASGSVDSRDETAVGGSVSAGDQTGVPAPTSKPGRRKGNATAKA